MSLKNSKFWGYVDGVIDGKILTGKLTRLAVERFIRDRDKGDYFFDEKEGRRIVDFIEKFCHHWKGSFAGKPILLLPHQHFYLINLFGWKREDGTRRFRRSYKEVARKNGKTSESGLKAIYLVSKDGEHGAQVFCAATKESQALIAVNDAGKFIQNSPKLKKNFQLFRHKENVSRIIYPRTDSFIRALGKDSERQDGLDPYVAVIDEYHAFTDNEVINVLESGMGMRRQPLVDIITTAGKNQAGPCFKFRKVCEEVLQGIKTDDALFTMIFSLDEEDSWEDPEVWEKANPNLCDPVIRKDFLMPYLKQRYQEAKNEGSSKETDFKTKNLNLWCDVPQVWIQDEVIQRNNHSTDPESLYGKMCYGGLDLASGYDLNAFVLYFPGEINCIRAWFWMPEDSVKQNRSNFNFSDWVRDGWIFTVPGNVIEFSYISQFIIDETPKYDFQMLSYDARMGLTGPIPALEDAGIPTDAFGQGIMTVSPAVKELERLLVSGKLELFNNPVMRWMFSNVVLRSDANANVALDRAKSAHKIDGISALVDAIGGFQRFPPRESVYKYRGVLSI
jgi:phage terminase large subunit-like protein